MPKTILDILNERKEVIRLNQQDKPNYFNWYDYLDLSKYSTYITVKPRGIGATYSAFQVALDWYEESGEHTTWMRTTFEEVKKIVNDYKTNPPIPRLGLTQKRYYFKGYSILDKENYDRVVINFVALSTCHNMASITGGGCGLIVYDEFLPRSLERMLKSAYNKLTDFIRTVERQSLMTVILQANSTTLNSGITLKWDIWKDRNELRDTKKRIWYTRFDEWLNPPKIRNLSTAGLWASNDETLQEYMDNAKFIDDGAGLVVPESRLGALRYYYQYKLNDWWFTLAMTDENKWVICEGMRMVDYEVFALTTTDLLGDGETRLPPDLETNIMKIYNGLRNNNLVFTNFELKDEVLNYLSAVYGRIQRTIM